MNALVMLFGVACIILGLIWFFIGAVGFWKLLAALGLGLFSSRTKRRNKIEAMKEEDMAEFVRLLKQHDRIGEMAGRTSLRATGKATKSDAELWKEWSERLKGDKGE